ncbi:hypothetical protein ACIXNV_22995 [Bacteroides fragilis]
MEARLTIKAVIRWEQLRGKSFSLMDYSDKEDVNALLYTSTIVAKGEVYTFDVLKRHYPTGNWFVRWYCLWKIGCLYWPSFKINELVQIR